ncbi:MAG: ferritin-like domain-containing protein [Candidatus Hodarchaeales archaeon]|jgi:bacterioferritin
MSKKSVDLVSSDKGVIIEELNKAYADEWIAYFQYLSLATIATGRGSFQFADAIKHIAKEELEHAEEVAGRILDLGGAPITDWDEINKKANCPYPSKLPGEKDLEGMARLILDDERCAIGVYDKLMSLTKEKDFITYNLMMHILEEEVQHENKMLQFLGE